ncbi:phosphoadenosine phosphosulfate reductase family protein [Streptomyces niveus]|uniref:phosphoadenosine phosphosulfate reductase family protein n=1 Tax=Streptomyces niveus TaxID=193462 RepID=UPI003433992B
MNTTTAPMSAAALLRASLAAGEAQSAAYAAWKAATKLEGRYRGQVTRACNRWLNAPEYTAPAERRRLSALHDAALTRHAPYKAAERATWAELRAAISRADIADKAWRRAEFGDVDQAEQQSGAAAEPHGPGGSTTSTTPDTSAGCGAAEVEQPPATSRARRRRKPRKLPTGYLDFNPRRASLADYDVIVFNSSGGKDSQAALDYVAEQARAAGVSDRVVVLHNDLGVTDSAEPVEWPGTEELAAEQAAHYGFRFETIRRALGGLWQQLIEQRKLFPSSQARWCTSDQKSSQGLKFLTRLVRELRGRGVTGRPIRILYVLGLRAEESSGRARKPELAVDRAASNGQRTVVRWHPILTWSEQRVWRRIADSGVRYHWAYDAGMDRLSCALCVLATRADLVCASRLRPALTDDYVRAEEITGHKFKTDLSIRDIRAEAQSLGPITKIRPGEAMRRRLGYSSTALYLGRVELNRRRYTTAA